MCFVVLQAISEPGFSVAYANMCKCMISVSILCDMLSFWLKARLFDVCISDHVIYKPFLSTLDLGSISTLKTRSLGSSFCEIWFKIHLFYYKHGKWRWLFPVSYRLQVCLHHSSSWGPCQIVIITITSSPWPIFESHTVRGTVCSPDV